jgi:hypothetical protein
MFREKTRLFDLWMPFSNGLFGATTISVTAISISATAHIAK